LREIIEGQQFLPALAPVAAGIRCGHTSLAPSPAIQADWMESGHGILRIASFDFRDTARRGKFEAFIDGFFDAGTPGYPELRLIKPARNKFSGTMYVLIDGGCFSTTGHLCSLLRYHGIGTFIGEETAGSFACTDNRTAITLAARDSWCAFPQRSTRRLYPA
jgi:hypothetical protein